ncbi:MAG: hypothetical protein ACTSWY_02090 [Promethearchaeota archaeon]
MAENKKWKLISLKIPSKMLEEWDNYAESRGMKRSEFIRVCCNRVIHPNEESLIDEVIKFHIKGLERRLLQSFQELKGFIKEKI